LSVGGKAPHRYLVRSQADSLQEESMSKAVRLGVIIPSVNVATSSQAVLWHALRAAGVRTSVCGFGQLLREH
jgi:hypothetical protein